MSCPTSARDREGQGPKAKWTSVRHDATPGLVYKTFSPTNTVSETANNTIGSHNRHIPPDTVRNRIRANDLRARRPYVGLPLTPARLAWLVAHSPRNFLMRQWRRVFFTDESRFTLYRADERRRVYRRRGERYTDESVVERDRFGGGSVCVWGGISYGFKSPLIVIDGNLTGVKY